MTKKLITLLAIILTVVVVVSCNEMTDSTELVDDSFDVMVNDLTSEYFESESAFLQTDSTEPQWRYIGYVDYMKNDPQKEYGEDVVNTYIKLPICYEETIDGLNCKVEWYKDTVFMHYYAVARITLTNNTGEALRYVCTDSYSNGFFRNNKEEEYFLIDSSEFSWYDDATGMRLLHQGESKTVFSLYWIDDSFFLADGINEFEYVCRVDDLLDSSKGKTGKRYEFSFPIEVNMKNN